MAVSNTLSLRGGSGTQSSTRTCAPSGGSVIDVTGWSTHKTSDARFTGSGSKSVSEGKVDATRSTTVVAGPTLALAGWSSTRTR